MGAANGLGSTLSSCAAATAPHRVLGRLLRSSGHGGCLPGVGVTGMHTLQLMLRTLMPLPGQTLTKCSVCGHCVKLGPTGSTQA